MNELGLDIDQLENVKYLYFPDDHYYVSFISTSISNGEWYSYQYLEDALDDSTEEGIYLIDGEITEKNCKKIYGLSEFLGIVKRLLEETSKKRKSLKLPKDLSVERLIQYLQQYNTGKYVVCQDESLFWCLFPENGSYLVNKLFKDTVENSTCYRIDEFISLLKAPTPPPKIEYVEDKGLVAGLKIVPEEVLIDFVFGGEKCNIRFGCAMEKPVKQWPPDERATTNGMVDIPFLLSI